ncbi:MAG: ATP-dependent helicase, partial [Pirellulales bacterium]|nr:ATP-dependent helicase [Pirellulales bacterium]
TALLTKFVRLFDRLSSATDGPVEEIVGLVISETGYQKRLQESEDEDDLQRLANIEELLTVARDFDERNGGAGRLEAFIEETCLVSDTDAWETEADRVTLMTLHASKGLEFPVVFLTAVEEGLLPHERSRERADQLEEERRLMFVGITRARQELQISMARYRDFRGQRKLTIPSSFLMELPRDEMELEHPRAESHVEDMWHDIDQRRVPFDDVESFGVAGRSVGPAVALPDRDGGRMRLTTGAALANGGQPAAPTAPDDFRQGMLVLHPVHGLGRIVAISGSGAGRKATIDFRPPAGRKKFMLVGASLQPVGKK